MAQGSLTTHGHSMKVERTRSGHRWRWSCECGAGWQKDGDPTRATEVAALSSAVRHGQLVKQEALRLLAVDGIRLPVTRSA